MGGSHCQVWGRCEHTHLVSGSPTIRRVKDPVKGTAGQECVQLHVSQSL